MVLVLLLLLLLLWGEARTCWWLHGTIPGGPGKEASVFVVGGGDDGVVVVVVVVVLVIVAVGRVQDLLVAAWNSSWPSKEASFLVPSENKKFEPIKTVTKRSKINAGTFPLLYFKCRLFMMYHKK